MSEWISVHDHLPTRDTDVLATHWCETCTELGQEYVIYQIKHDGEQWKHCELALGRITHWMPLPEQPNE